jgi:hypothetical protein
VFAIRPEAQLPSRRLGRFVSRASGAVKQLKPLTLHPAEEFSELEFFHIKLETHDVIHAEGAPCETLLTVDESLRNFADYFRRYGEPQGEDQPCVPVLSYGGSGRRAIKSRLRSAMSPWIDHRQQFDVIRDRLEERALALGRRLEAV